MEHPQVARALATGYPDGEPEWPMCPVCGNECDTVYRDEDGEIWACDECVKTQSAWEASECFKEEY